MASRRERQEYVKCQEHELRKQADDVDRLENVKQETKIKSVNFVKQQLQTPLRQVGETDMFMSDWRAKTRKGTFCMRDDGEAHVSHVWGMSEHTTQKELTCLYPCLR